MITSHMAPLNAPHQLHLAVRFALIVHSSQSPFVNRERNAVLRIVGLKPVGCELVNAESTGEEAPAITCRLKVDGPNIAEHCWMKLHWITPSSSYAMALLWLIGACQKIS